VAADGDVPLAQRAVMIHQAEEWPGMIRCRNCGGRWPCRLDRWGRSVLRAAGWSDADVAEFIESAARRSGP